MSNFRRLVRNLRLMTDKLVHESPGIITVHEDCPECGSRVAFEFKDIALRQTVYVNCWKCEETLRMVKTPDGQPPQLSDIWKH